MERLTLPEVERILKVESRKTALSKLRSRKKQLEKEYAEAELRVRVPRLQFTHAPQPRGGPTGWNRPLQTL